MASAVINQPLRDVSIDSNAVTLCCFFRQYVATGSIKYMAHQLIDLALVMSEVSSSVADRVVYPILLVPPAVFYVQSLGNQILTLKCQKLEFVVIRTFWREIVGDDCAILFLRN
jgi:hypothetical protein